MPVEPSASARRVVAVLTCLAGGDQIDLTLTEIAAATEMNKTTCQSILLALGDTGFVRRDDNRKTYRLGPAVLALATATGVHQESLARARAAKSCASTIHTVATRPASTASFNRMSQSLSDQAVLPDDERTYAGYHDQRSHLTVVSVKRSRSPGSGPTRIARRGAAWMLTTRSRP